jgi:hypothetical protein
MADLLRTLQELKGDQTEQPDRLEMLLESLKRPPEQRATPEQTQQFEQFMERHPAEIIPPKRKSIAEKFASRETPEMRDELNIQHIQEVLKKPTVTEDGKEIPPVGGELDPEKTAPNDWLSFTMGRSRSFNDMAEKFKKRYPRGELTIVKTRSGFDRILFRENPEAKWGLADRNAAAWAADILTPQTGLTVAAAGLTMGSALPIIVAGQAVAGAAGSVADIIIEKESGYAKDISRTEMAGEAALEGGFAAAGAATPGVYQGAKAAFGRMSNFNLGNLFRREMEHGERFMRAAEEESLPAPMVGQASGDPKIRQMASQTSSVSSTFPKGVTAQAKGLEQGLRRKALEEGYDSLSLPQLERLKTIQELEIRQNLPTVQGTDILSASSSAKIGIDNWAVTSQAEFQKRLPKVGARARAVGLQIDISDLKAEAARISRPTMAPGQEGPVGLGAPTGRLAAVLDKINSLDNTLANFKEGGVTSDAVSQGLALRNELHDLATTGSPKEREIAKGLHDRLRGAMENPIGYRGNVEMRGGRLAGDLLDLFDEVAAFEDKKSLFRGVLDTSDPGNLAERLVRPNNFEMLHTFRNVAPQEFMEVRDAFMSKMLADPDNIEKTFKAYQGKESTLRLLMSEEDEAVFRAFARNNKIIKGERVQTLLNAQAEATDKAAFVMFGGKNPLDPARKKLTIRRPEVERLVTNAGGKNSPEANALRSGLFGHILNTNLVTSGEAGGRRVINPQGIRAMIDDVLSNKTNLEPLMRPQDWRSLENFASYASMIESTNLSGQLSGQQKVAHLGSLTRFITTPQHYMLTIASIANSEQLARILSQPVTSEMFKNAVEAGPTREGIAGFLGAATTAIRSLERDYPVVEE